MELNPPKILLVEDNPDDAALTMRAFQRNNLKNEIVHARDGEEALNYLFARGEFAERSVDDRPYLILLDLKLPKVDGLEVLEQIRADERIQLTPVIILTSSREQEDRLRSYSLGANSYVRKPVDFRQFVEAVRQLGLYWMVMNESPYS